MNNVRMPLNTTSDRTMEACDRKWHEISEHHARQTENLLILQLTKNGHRIGTEFN